MHLRETIADPRAIMMVATRGWFGSGSAYDIAVTALSAASGFTAFWTLRRGATVRWTVTGGEGDLGSTEEVRSMFVRLCPGEGRQWGDLQIGDGDGDRAMIREVRVNETGPARDGPRRV